MINDLGVETSADVLTLIYDGECPFCSRFVSLYRIRQNVGSLHLVDARQRPEIVRILRAADIEINEGMVAIWHQAVYHGADSVHLMAMLGADGVFARVNSLLFRNRTVAASTYPMMVAGRRLALRLLGRSLIGSNPTDGTG